MIGRRLPRLRPAGALVAVAAAAVSLAACGSGAPVASAAAGTVPAAPGPPSAAALDTVRRAVATTSGASAAFEMAFSDVPAGSRSVTPQRAVGVVDFGGPASTIELDLPAGSGGTERMVFLPGTVFIKPPSSSPPLQPGRPWIFANFSDIDRYRVNFPPYIVQTESVNPAFVVDELAWGAVSAVPLGRAALAGRSAAAYRVTVDLQRALSQATGPAADVFGHALQSELTASGTGAANHPSLAVEVWVDGSGRLIGTRAAPLGAGIGTVTLDLTRFGTPVHAGKPPRDKVVDIAAMIPGGEQEALNGGDSDGA